MPLRRDMGLQMRRKIVRRKGMGSDFDTKGGNLILRFEQSYHEGMKAHNAKLNRRVMFSRQWLVDQ